MLAGSVMGECTHLRVRLREESVSIMQAAEIERQARQWVYLRSCYCRAGHVPLTGCDCVSVRVTVLGVFI